MGGGGGSEWARVGGSDPTPPLKCPAHAWGATQALTVHWSAFVTVRDFEPFSKFQQVTLTTVLVGTAEVNVGDAVPPVPTWVFRLSEEQVAAGVGTREAGGRCGA